jgi:cell wall-associated NlpC family hydrolase
MSLVRRLPLPTPLRTTLAVTAAATVASLVIGSLAPGASAATGHAGDHHHRASRAAARADAANLRTAAQAVENSALASGALTDPIPSARPATVLLDSVVALLTKAQQSDPDGQPTSTVSVMGAVPQNLLHRPARHPRHRRVVQTHAFSAVTHAVRDRGSRGWGLRRRHDGARPAVVQKADGIYVDPALPALADPTVAEVAVRAALQKLGQPYVWAGAGPVVFDCSGLTQWAYAKAGVRLGHYTGLQWNEGRLVPVDDILPGDLILFEEKVRHHEYIHHVGMYLGAGWMVNAPYTGQYVNVVPVPHGVAGVVRP